MPGGHGGLPRRGHRQQRLGRQPSVFPGAAPGRRVASMVPCRLRPGPIARIGSVGRKGIANSMLPQAAEPARSGPVPAPQRANGEALAKEDPASTTDPTASSRLG